MHAVDLGLTLRESGRTPRRGYLIGCLDGHATTRLRGEQCAAQSMARYSTGLTGLTQDGPSLRGPH